MSRYFKVELAPLGAIRAAVMVALEQPNERADEPWRPDGDFADGTYGYVTLGAHHVTGEFAEMFEEFLGTPGVEEITREQYVAAMPREEGHEPLS